MDIDTIKKLARRGVKTYQPAPGMIAFHDRDGRCIATMRMIAPDLRANPRLVETLPESRAKHHGMKARTRLLFASTKPWLRRIEREWDGAGR